MATVGHIQNKNAKTMLNQRRKIQVTRKSSNADDDYQFLDYGASRKEESPYQSQGRENYGGEPSRAMSMQHVTSRSSFVEDMDEVD